MIENMYFVDLCERVLRLCKLTPEETLCVVSDQSLDSMYTDAFLAAATRIGAAAYCVGVPRLMTNELGEDVGYAGEGVIRAGTGINALGRNRPALNALKGADLIIDRINILFSPQQHELLAEGARILTCTQSVDHLIRLFPTLALQEVTEAACARLDRASSLRFTNAAGTDVTYDLGPYEAAAQYGFVDRAGRWDHWPSGGFVYSGASDDGVNGTVVLAKGDLMAPGNRYISEDVTFTIEEGLITDIRGGTDALIIKDYMKSWNDPRGYRISHIGWGTDPRARMHYWARDQRGISMEARAVAGCVMFSTGPNTELKLRGSEQWGQNTTPCHLDFPMYDCSLFLDDEPIVIDGAIVDSDQLLTVAGAAA
jgi:2,5-dihydroxypyridine 5,6-dioxygenase